MELMKHHAHIMVYYFHRGGREGKEEVVHMYRERRNVLNSHYGKEAD